MNDAPQTHHEMRWFLAGVGGYFFAGGIGSVMIPWILAFVLNESAERIGIGQMAVMAPMLVLSLFGGVTADRSELRRLLSRLQLATAVAPLALMVSYVTGYLSFTTVICYAIAVSALGAYTMPARDSLLSRVAQRAPEITIQQVVAAATGWQFLSQVAGLLLGGTAQFLGAPFLLVAQSASLVMAAFTTRRLPPAPAAHHKAPHPVRRSRLKDIGEGIGLVWHNESVRPVVLLMFFSGILYIGVFMVLFPVLVRDVYQGGSFEIAFINVCFFGGIGVSSIIQSRRVPIKRQGRAIMLAMCTGSTVMIFLHFGPPLWVVNGLALTWGLSAGISMSQSRAVVQAQTSDANRARILSVFQLGNMGGGPIGSFAAGYVISWLGPLDAVLLPSAAMVVLWLSIFAFTDLWRVEAPAPQAVPAQ